MSRQDTFIYVARVATFIAALVVFLLVFYIGVTCLVVLFLDDFPYAGPVFYVIAGLLAGYVTVRTAKFIYKLVRALLGIDGASMARQDAFIYLARFAAVIAAIVVSLLVFNMTVSILVGFFPETFPYAGLVFSVTAGLLAGHVTVRTEKFIYKLVRALLGIEPEAPADPNLPTDPSLLERGTAFIKGLTGKAQYRAAKESQRADSSLAKDPKPAATKTEPPLVKMDKPI